jgi:hypothetical protein
MTESTRSVDEFGIIWWKLPDGIFHREDGPAIEYPDGHRAWYLNGKHHREDGPALIQSNGKMWWYQNGKMHRDDGPVIVHPDGFKCWYLDGVAFDKLSQITPELELKYPEFCKSFAVYHIMTE